MTEHVANNSRIFKADAPLSNTAKLLRAYMECSGIHCAKTISKNLGINLRTIYRLKLDIAASCATGGTATSATCATDGTIETASCATGGTLARIDNNINTNQDKFSEVKENKSLPQKREATGTRLPVAWQLPDDWRSWARVTFPHSTAESVQLQADSFRDFWIAKAGAGGRKADWEATWRNWCRRSLATAPIRPNAQPFPDWKEAKHAKTRALLDDLRSGALS